VSLKSTSVNSLRSFSDGRTIYARIELALNRLFDQRQDVAHPQAPAGPPVGAGRLRAWRVLATTMNLNRHPRHALNGGPNRAGVAVDARRTSRRVESLLKALDE